MRKAWVAAAVALLVCGAAYAGDWHFGTNLICSDCHVMHASLQHSYGGSTAGFPKTYTPSKYLLKGTVNETCLSCHNDNGAPDVFGADTGYFLTNRSAGALNNVAGPVDGYEHWMGHTLGTTDPAPGDTGSFTPDPTEGLHCTDCHHQHGFHMGAVDVAGHALAADPNGTYRNLRPRAFGGVSVSYAKNTNDLTRDVFEAFSNAYETADVNLNEPNTTNSGFGTWCQDCHVNFHGAVGDPDSIGGSGDPPTEFIRHPNATVNIGAVGGGHSSLNVFRNRLYRVRVMSASGDWGPDGSTWDTAPTDLTPTCLSCHKAHGNKRPFGLIYARGSAPLGEDGDGTGARDLCKQCHAQGG